jgi:methylglyoxal synthase
MKRLNIALVAHDARKQELVDWCTHNAQWLSRHTLYGTGTTAKMLSTIPVINDTSDLPENAVIPSWYMMPLRIQPLLSGPLGGDQQIGAMLANGELGLIIFLRDPLTAQPHEPDVSALLRLCDVQRLPLATNASSATVMLECMKNGIYFKK